MSEKTIKENVENYYGDVLETKDDLKTSACCPIDAMPVHLRGLLQNIHPEIQEKFYGCGSPIPSALEGKTVLDLGCGTGRDVYMVSQLVGPNGKVIGVDMTDKQLAVAQAHLDHHMTQFGYEAPNVVFHKGDIEDLAALGIADRSVDVVISNCVINLSDDKEAVFKEIFRVLKPGGELYFSDVFADRRIPEHLAKDPVLLGECLGGAMYVDDFRRLIQKVGCLDFRVVSQGEIALHDPDVIQKAGMIGFVSMTIRAFNCDLEDDCEEYGHVATYQGGLTEHPHQFDLDNGHRFKTGVPERVCGNTALMLSESRYSDYFKIDGDFSTHYGHFDCQPASTAGSADGGCC